MSPHTQDGAVFAAAVALTSTLTSICCYSGHVTWDEYRVKFLASKGLNEKEVAEKIKNNEDLKLDEESECMAIYKHSCYTSPADPY